jgi:hypothetical protein
MAQVHAAQGGVTRERQDAVGGSDRPATTNRQVVKQVVKRRKA